MKIKIKNIIPLFLSSTIKTYEYLKNHFVNLSDSLRKVLVNIFIIILLLIVFVYICCEVTKHQIFIDPFDVPNELINCGYSGIVVANLLCDKLDLINKSENISYKKRGKNTILEISTKNNKIFYSNLSPTFISEPSLYKDPKIYLGNL